jgi:hypothetical protein
MGERPHGTSIDRIDNDKGYFKENCRWATRSEQQINKSNRKRISFMGDSKTITEWAKLFGINESTLFGRVFRRNFSIEEAILTPVRKRQ